MSMYIFTHCSSFRLQMNFDITDLQRLVISQNLIPFDLFQQSASFSAACDVTLDF